MSTEEHDAQRLALLFAALENEPPPAEAPAWPQPELEPEVEPEPGSEPGGQVVDALFAALHNDPPPPRAPALPAAPIRLVWWRDPRVRVGLALAAALIVGLVAWSMAGPPAPPDPVVRVLPPGDDPASALAPPAPHLGVPAPTLVQSPPRPAPPSPAPTLEEPEEIAVVDAWEPAQEDDDPSLIPKGVDLPDAPDQAPAEAAPELALVLVSDGPSPAQGDAMGLGTALRFRMRASAPAEITLCVVGPELDGALWTGRVPAGQRDLHGVLYLLEQPGSYLFGLALGSDCRELGARQRVEVTP